MARSATKPMMVMVCTALAGNHTESFKMVGLIQCKLRQKTQTKH